MSYIPSTQAEDIALEKRELWSVQGYGAENGGIDVGGMYEMVKEPTIRAVFMGFTSWGLARLVKAQPKVAKRIGLVTAGMEFLISVGSEWLRQELKKVQ